MADQQDRIERLDSLVQESYTLIDQAISTHIDADGKRLKGICVLYSGGNDSTVLTHLMRTWATHAIHANTGIGIERTREFVRDTSRTYGLPLLEVHPGPGNTYREMVLEHGFPGPGHHYKMFQRLKERGLRSARRELVTNPRQERVVFLAGRRRDESNRRINVPELEREGSVVWVSPLVNWTALDLNTYRLQHPDVPRNEVSDLLHMSGECLCGSFARSNELDEIALWFPDVAAEIRALEAEVLATGKFPEYRCRWGWGGDKATLRASRKSGRLCSSCDARFKEAA